MTLPRDAMLLRIFFGEDDKFKAGRSTRPSSWPRARPISPGPPCLRGPMGFGHSSRLHTTKILRLSEDLPMVIEIVDTRREDQGVPADPRRDDAERPRHAGEGAGAAIRRRTSSTRPPDGRRRI